MTYAVLFINRTDSECGACKGNVPFGEESHMTTLGWDGQTEGCGAKYIALSSYYTGMDDAVKACRPDLDFYQFAVQIQSVLDKINADLTGAVE